jgi:hypothetical protein
VFGKRGGNTCTEKVKTFPEKKNCLVRSGKSYFREKQKKTENFIIEHKAGNK